VDVQNGTSALKLHWTVMRVFNSQYRVVAFKWFFTFGDFFGVKGFLDYDGLLA
jgi:hypothetical protein